MKLALSIAEAAEALGVSDDLLYELTARGEIPCVQLGRRKVIPVRVIESVLEECLRRWEPASVAEAVPSAAAPALPRG